MLHFSLKKIIIAETATFMLYALSQNTIKVIISSILVNIWSILDILNRSVLNPNLSLQILKFVD